MDPATIARSLMAQAGMDEASASQYAYMILQDPEGSQEILAELGLSNMVSSIKEKYPLFRDVEVRDERSQGVQNGRRLEFTEPYDDRTGKPLIQIFDPSLQGQELERAIIGEIGRAHV